MNKWKHSSKHVLVCVDMTNLTEVASWKSQENYYMKKN